MRPIDADALSEHKFVGIKFIQIGGRTNGKTLEAVNRAYQQGWNDAIDAIIDNAPTVDTTRKIQSELISEICHSIARQFSEHNEVVPFWLSIGDIRIKEAENE